ncbi:MAG: porphobilinogen synthase [Flavobacteriales bacterium Tduv]
MLYPYIRHRRLRTRESIRKMIQETTLITNDLQAPLFICEGITCVKEPIASMPDYYRMSLDLTVKEALSLWKLGIKSVLLFVKVPRELKDNKGTEALNPDGLMQRSISAIKEALPEMIVMTDVALDPYSIYGHDGIVEGNEILNDPSVETLAQMALSHARAGADFIAPSDMMDGRIGAIREVLEENGFPHVGIMSYGAKYASNFYGPFREALDSVPGFRDKKTYQMDYHNAHEAFREAQTDIEEGADIVMVKPGLPYLDIVRLLRDRLDAPIAVYQVSGEYAMIKAAANQGWMDGQETMIESLICIKRAGADIITTYFAKEAAMILQNT